MRAATASNNLEMFNLLLNKGANVNEYLTEGPYTGYTPLHFAAMHGSLTDVKFLLENRANPNILGADGLTALACAYWEKNTDVINLLTPFTTEKVVNLIGLGEDTDNG